MRTRYQLILVCALVLLAFSPVGQGEFSPIDDSDMLRAIGQMTLSDYVQSLLPRSLLYYRPMIGLSYLMDKYLFDLDPGLMHLHNVLLHAMNGMLVFLLTRKLLTPQEREGSFFPLAAALVFALHPITTESVCWISGRTDILSLFFLLLSTLSMLHFRESAQRRDLALSLLAFFFAFVTKETSIAFLPGLFLVWWARPEQQDGATERPLWFRLLPGILLLLSAAGGFFLMRHLAVTLKHGSTLGMTLKFFFTDWSHSLLVLLRAFGFYLKKLLIPYPLNFAILEVDPLYELLAIPLLLACTYIATRRTVVCAIFTTGMLLITPSFILAFNQVAWTPYAERYIYMTCAFVTVAALFYLRRNLRLPQPGVGPALVACLLVVMAATTFDRSLIWQSNFTLCRDTVDKSPYSRDMKILYGSLLAQQGDYQGAIRETTAANAIPGLGYDERPDINLACLYRDMGQLDKAISISRSCVRKNRWKSSRALDNLASLYELKKNQAVGSERRELERELFAVRLCLFKLNQDYVQLYHLGNLCRGFGENEKAFKLYRQAMYNLPAESQERQLAQRAMRSVAMNKEQLAAGAPAPSAAKEPGAI